MYACARACVSLSLSLSLSVCVCVCFFIIFFFGTEAKTQMSTQIEAATETNIHYRRDVAQRYIGKLATASIWATTEDSEHVYLGRREARSWLIRSSPDSGWAQENPRN